MRGSSSSSASAIGIATTAAAVSASTSLSPVAAAAQPTLSPGAIAGIVIAALIVGALGAGAAGWLLLRRKRRRAGDGTRSRGYGVGNSGADYYAPKRGVVLAEKEAGGAAHEVGGDAGFRGELDGGVERERDREMGGGWGRG